MIWKICPDYKLIKNITSEFTYHVFLAILLWEIDIDLPLYYMHDFKISVAVLTMTFLEIMFVKTLCGICVVW